MRSGYVPTRLYNRMVSLVPIVCVDLVLTEGHGRYLLILRKDQPVRGYWWFPGGRILKGETILAAARRKAREECGVSVTVDRIVGVYETIFRTARPGVVGGTHTVNIVVHVRVRGRQSLALDQHHRTARWFVGHPPRDWHGYLDRALRDAMLLRG